MVTYASAHLPSHPSMQNIGARMTTRGRRLAISCAPALACSQRALCCDKSFDICMHFSVSFHAGRLSFVILFVPYIDLASHVFVVSVQCIFKISIPAKETLYVL